MEAMYSGLVIVPIIVGLVEIAKRLGLGGAYAAPLAVGLGLMISLGHPALAGVPGGEAWMEAAVRGTARGLSAAGLHSDVRCRQDDRKPAQQGR